MRVILHHQRTLLLACYLFWIEPQPRYPRASRALAISTWLTTLNRKSATATDATNMTAARRNVRHWLHMCHCLFKFALFHSRYKRDLEPRHKKLRQTTVSRDCCTCYSCTQLKPILLQVAARSRISSKGIPASWTWYFDRAYNNCQLFLYYWKLMICILRSTDSCFPSIFLAILVESAISAYSPGTINMKINVLLAGPADSHGFHWLSVWYWLNLRKRVLKLRLPRRPPACRRCGRHSVRPPPWLYRGSVLPGRKWDTHLQRPTIHSPRFLS